MGKITKHFNPPVPPNTPCVLSNSLTTNPCSQMPPGYIDKTLRRGRMLGIIRPYWTKVLESEQRIAWLKTMIGKNLVVRDLESYARAISEKLRTEELKFKEEERFLLMGIMRLKLKDEKLNLIELNKKKENMRQTLIGEIGKNRRYDNIMRYLRKELNARKTYLKAKYKKKINHLEKERKKEI